MDQLENNTNQSVNVNYKIRPLTKNDVSACRNICLSTARNADITNKKIVNRLLCLYCDYYLEFPDDTCFVIADDNDVAVGYVFCAPDYKRYEKSYRKHFLKKLIKISIIDWIGKRLELRYHRRFIRHPAHLHINILPIAQRKGLGHQLIGTLEKKLFDLGVRGLHLAVGKGNEKGISFYKKYGFSYLGMRAGTVFFGRTISE
ncbi:MAG: GNAT family N-acetyltransferase [Christensenellaceae bacterium]|jgi:ribosomal protein S18 acetylase RimI-like enzyme|nr:GNAT family N-acetyltransferase [Christensenellaceae bacterium]